MGFEVLNPVQPNVPGHLPKDMKDNIQNDVSPERVLMFIELCKKHGKY